MRELQAQGVTFLFISHHLQEVYEICQAVTVLRDAKHIISAPVADLTKDRLIEAMTGEQVQFRLRRRGRPNSRRPRSRRARGRDLSAARISTSVSFPGAAAAKSSASAAPPAAAASAWPRPSPGLARFSRGRSPSMVDPCVPGDVPAALGGRGWMRAQKPAQAGSRSHPIGRRQRDDDDRRHAWTARLHRAAPARRDGQCTPSIPWHRHRGAGAAGFRSVGRQSAEGGDGAGARQPSFGPGSHGSDSRGRCEIERGAAAGLSRICAGKAGRFLWRAANWKICGPAIVFWSCDTAASLPSTRPDGATMLSWPRLKAFERNQRHLLPCR